MWSDLRYALRSLRKTPGFTIAAVLCLALGIGANTAIFTLIDAALLRMLPVADPEQLVLVEARNPRPQGEGPAGGGNFSYPAFAHLRDHADSVAGLLASSSIDLHLSAGDLTDAPKGALVSDGYFSVLGVQPIIGRAPTAADGVAGGVDGAVLSYRYWRSRFDGDPAIVGRGISINGLPFTVVGIAPRGFFGVEVGRAPDVFVPLAAGDRLLPGLPRLQRANSFWLTVMARLRPDVPAARAAAQTDVVFHQGIDAQSAAMPPGLVRFLRQRRVTFVPGARGPTGFGDQFGTPLLILMTVVGVVLLIACANVANLLLARAAARRREMAVRLALGAGRARLVRQLLTESLTLSIAGGALGLAFAVWSARGLTTYLATRVLDVNLDLRVLAFTLIASIATGLLFGAAPALMATRQDLTPAFKGDALSYGARRGRGGARAGRVLVTGQVALSLLLLVGAGLFIRTLANLRAMDPGFRGDRVLLATLNPGLSGYTPDRIRAFYNELLERVSALPGVQAASVANIPLLGGAYLDGFRVEATNQNVDSAFRLVSPRFFETMGIAIRRGRDFLPSDRHDAPNVALINETIARRYFAGVDPIGQFINVGKSRAEIVGVVADTKYRTLRAEVPNTLYLPLEQGVSFGAERTLHVRTFAGPASMAAAVRDQVRAIDRDMPGTIATFADLVDENLAQERLIATLSGFFGGLALLLTAIGLYGVIAYTVQRRTREIGIRMSLGAARAAVLWLVLRDALLLIAAGLVAGTIASVWLSRLVARQLFGIAPGDLPTMVAAAVFVMAVATVAGYVPARRASRVDPTVALRYE